MTRRQPIHHSCTFYCQGGQHALVCLAAPERTATDIQAWAVPALALEGWQVVRVWPAREADPQQWRVTHHHWDIPPTPNATACWLILVAPLAAPEAIW